MASMGRSGWAIAVLGIAAFLVSPVPQAAAKAARPAASATKALARSRAHSAAAVSLPVVEKDAAIVVDGASGRVLYARNADEPRKPASLTKMMTLYLLFEQLHEGNLTLTSKLTASKHASSMEPTKLGVLPGDKVDVETAIKAIAVLSANDVAVMIAENIGKTEDEFGLLMTAKARSLGMTRSNFHNASGLPDPLQVTSAHDMALLGRHLAYDFPQYYGYFATPSFSYDGRIYETHDHLLGAFDGVDGIKTGYTRASGFNLVTSAVRNNKHVVGVVMGGMSWVSRDQEMVRLLSQAFDFAQQNPAMLADADPPWRGGKGPGLNPFSTRPTGSNVMVASLNSSPAPTASKSVPAAAPWVSATAPKPLTAPAVAPKPVAPAPAAALVAAAEILPRPLPGLAHVKAPVPKPAMIASIASAKQPVEKPASKEPAPVVVAANSATTIPPFAANVRVPAKFHIPMALPVEDEIKAGVVLASISTPSSKERAPSRVLQGDMTGLSLLFNAVNRPGREPASADAKSSAPATAVQIKLEAPAASAKPAQAVATPVPTAPAAESHRTAAESAPATHPSATGPSRRWLVQIGAFPSEPLAQAGLASYVKLDEQALAQAERMVVPVSSLKGHTVYRARFGLFAEDEARRICSSLAQHGKQCFATAAN